MSRKKSRIVKLGANEDFKKQMAGRVLPWDLQSVSRMRSDIKSWVEAENMALSSEPKTYPLQLLLSQVANDALLFSQLQNRKQQLFTSSFSLKNGKGDLDEEQTDKLKKSALYRDITNSILDADMLWYSVVELSGNKDDLKCITLPRTNIIPQTGTFYRNYSEETNPVKFRELPEFGKYILEFTGQELGLLNKVVPHVLMKKFAQSCWSELCEIYGIPPRVMKTNTRDTSMLNRAKTMMTQMGAAAWFIIDTNESFEWANAVTTKGEVYSELINLCNNEISMAISGAIIGQDTKNGNRSKDESAQDILWQLVQADMEKVEQQWNAVVIPALQKIGWLNGDVQFEFDPQEDVEQLFKFTTGLLPFKQIDNAWIKEKFGVEVTGDKTASTDSNEKEKDKTENLSFDFFV
ncbi:phage portal protein family protein [Niabella insulamsoli]|uniref:phage portal protein family protein n=1 Tax=Niabella insulamsoli TaxID=3144874 RepID=UPI0031FC741D